MHLHVEIENLRQHLVERDNHIVTMETQFLKEAEKFPNGELASLKEEMLIWQDKYTRLYEAHKRVQKVNQNLEDKLLKIVDKCETEKGAFTKDIATLSHRLAEANYTIHRLTQDNVSSYKCTSVHTPRTHALTPQIHAYTYIHAHLILCLQNMYKTVQIPLKQSFLFDKTIKM